jgi:hypothetical protein
MIVLIARGVVTIAFVSGISIMKRSVPGDGIWVCYLL